MELGWEEEVLHVFFAEGVGIYVVGVCEEGGVLEREDCMDCADVVDVVVPVEGEDGVYCCGR